MLICVGFGTAVFVTNGETDSMVTDAVVLLDVLCSDKRGGRPLSLGGTGVAPSICAFRSAEFE